MGPGTLSLPVCHARRADKEPIAAFYAACFIVWSAGNSISIPAVAIVGGSIWHAWIQIGTHFATGALL